MERLINDFLDKWLTFNRDECMCYDVQGCEVYYIDIINAINLAFNLEEHGELKSEDIFEAWLINTIAPNTRFINEYFNYYHDYFLQYKLKRKPLTDEERHEQLLGFIEQMGRIAEREDAYMDYTYVDHDAQIMEDIRTAHAVPKSYLGMADCKMGVSLENKFPIINFGLSP